MARQRILICGLPGSGKTTFATQLKQLLETAFFTVEHFNADEVRKAADDWDFSEEGRKRQAERMRVFALKSTADVALMDFVAPTMEIRQNVMATCTVWMNTISEGRFKDTNQIFQRAVGADFTVAAFSPMYVAAVASSMIATREFYPSLPTVQLLGRYQPWHAGHRALFLKALAKTRQVAIMVRAGMWDDPHNPFSYREVEANIHADLRPMYNGLYTVMQVPNIVNITYGRDVGYKIEQEHLGAEIESISATKIREQGK